jgi:hypothetical protein
MGKKGREEMQERERRGKERQIIVEKGREGEKGRERNKKVEKWRGGKEIERKEG